MPLLPQLLLFAVAVAFLTGLSRWIALRIQLIGLRLTGNANVAIMGYYLLLLPGIFLHELSHYVMAWLLGMKLGKFALGPKRRKGNAIELGSVTVGRGGALRESLVGLAPFLGGTAVLLAVGYGVFNVPALGQAWTDGGSLGVLRALDGIWTVPDFWVWAYVIFAVSNVMTPSPADRQPWLTAGIYIALVLLVAYFLGGLPVVPVALAAQVAAALQLLTLAFLFTLGLDVVAAAVLWGIEALIAAAQTGRDGG